MTPPPIWFETFSLGPLLGAWPPESKTQGHHRHPPRQSRRDSIGDSLLGCTLPRAL